jgi:hypothetical protein
MLEQLTERQQIQLSRSLLTTQLLTFKLNRSEFFIQPLDLSLIANSAFLVLSRGCGHTSINISHSLSILGLYFAFLDLQLVRALTVRSRLVTVNDQLATQLVNFPAHSLKLRLGLGELGSEATLDSLLNRSALACGLIALTFQLVKQTGLVVVSIMDTLRSAA